MPLESELPDLWVAVSDLQQQILEASPDAFGGWPRWLRFFRHVQSLLVYGVSILQTFAHALQQRCQLRNALGIGQRCERRVGVAGNRGLVAVLLAVQLGREPVGLTVGVASS